MSDWQECNAIVRSHVAEILSVEEGSLDNAIPLVDYGLDSLRAMALAIALEHKFALTIDDNEMQNLQTIADITDYMVKER